MDIVLALVKMPAMTVRDSPYYPIEELFESASNDELYYPHTTRGRQALSGGGAGSCS
jgi:hypothetical protein